MRAVTYLRPAALAGALVLIACAPVSPERGQPAASPSEPQAEQPQYGGVFNLAMAQGPDNLDPQRVGSGAPATALFRTLFDALLEYRQDRPLDDYRHYEPVPWLAERWEQPDPLTYVFSLRRGLQWHDGEPLTARDVVFTYERLRDPANAFPNRSLLAVMREMEVVDDYTLRVVLSRPSAEFLETLADNPRLAILPRHVAERGEDLRKTAVGSGPFRLESFDKDKGAVLARSDRYWQTGKPYVGGIQLFYGLDKSALQAAVVAQRNDYYLLTDKVQFDALTGARRDLDHQSHVTEYNYGIRFNLSRRPFDDVRVRRAFHLSLDRTAMLNTLTFGLGGYDQPGASAVSRDGATPQEEILRTPGWRQPKDQDIAEAKRLLAEAGLADGFKTSLLFATTNSAHPGLVEMAASHAKRVGIEVVATGLELAAANRKHADGDYDLSIAAGGIRPRPDLDLQVQWHSRGSQSKAGVEDAALDDLIDRQSRELNPQERRRMLTEINRLLLDKMYIAPTVAGGYISVWQPYVKNLFLSYSGQAWLRFPAEVWLDKSRLPAERLPQGAGG